MSCPPPSGHLPLVTHTHARHPDAKRKGPVNSRYRNTRNDWMFQGFAPQRKGPVNSRYRNTRNDWMFQGFAPQHDEDAGRTRHPDAKRKGPVKSCITKKRLVLFARDACCWSVDVLFFLIIS